MVDVDGAVRSARKAFGHVPGITDKECLVRRIMQIERHGAERLALMKENRRLHDRLRALEAALRNG